MVLISRKIEFPIKESVDPNTGSLSFPIHQTSAFLMPEGEKFRYSRESNPTVEELARIIAILENTEAATCFASGMGAISTTMLALCRPGSKVLVHKDTFARTYRFITEFLVKWGVKAIVPELGNEAFVREAENADIVFLESLTNPILRVYDVQAISKAVHSNNGLLVVDETFATPINQCASDLGADVVIQSLSKFISGHNDVIGGSAAGKRILVEKIDNFRRTLGTTMDPNTAFLTLRGIKTLKTRIIQINRTALEIAETIGKINGFSSVRYPGLVNHPDREIALRNLEGFGGVVTFDIKIQGDPLEAMKRMSIITPANTLGGVNSTISHPSTMSHRSLSAEEKKSLGVSHETFRLSVGLEDPEDLINDLKKMVS